MGDRNRYTDQKDSDDHGHELDATRGAGSGEGTRGVRKHAALAEQRVENAAGENTGDRVDHDIAKLEDQSHEAPNSVLGLVGYRGPGDDLDARVGRGKGHEEGEGQHSDGQNAGGGSWEESENAIYCQETCDVGKVNPLHVEHTDDQARNDYAHDSDGMDRAECGLIREIEQHRGEQSPQEARVESGRSNQDYQHDDA